MYVCERNCVCVNAMYLRNGEIGDLIEEEVYQCMHTYMCAIWKYIYIHMCMYVCMGMSKDPLKAMIYDLLEGKTTQPKEKS